MNLVGHLYAGAKQKMIRVGAVALTVAILSGNMSLSVLAEEPSGAAETPVVTENVTETATEAETTTKNAVVSKQAIVTTSVSEVKGPVSAGQKFDITFTFKNTGDTKAISPTVSFSPSDAFIILNGSSTFTLNDIDVDGTQSVTLNMKVADEVAAANQAISLDMKYSYDNGESRQQGTTSDRVNISANVTQGKKTVAVSPSLAVSVNPIGKTISAGEVVTATFTISNRGYAKALRPTLSLTPSDSLTLADNNSTIFLGDIEAGKSVSVNVNLKAGKEISSANQTIGADVKYSYNTESGILEGSSSDKVTLAANATTNNGTVVNASVPNIIIDKYNYGDTSVSAGGEFNLAFSFKNAGKRKIENIVVNVNGGDTFTVNGVTNTYYYEKVAAGEVQKLEIPMQAVSGAKSGAQNVEIGFKYEYMDNSNRATASTSVQISVPVSQPDRFEVQEPTLPESLVVGTESTIYINYVNKGKVDIYNLEASVEGKNVTTLANTQYIGNVAAGSSNTLGFALTPTKTGDIDVILKLSYEDPDQKVRTKEFPITLKVVEETVSEDSEMLNVEESKSKGSPILVVGIVLLIAIGAVSGGVYLKKKRLNEQNTFEYDEEDWSADQDEQE